MAPTETAEAAALEDVLAVLAAGADHLEDPPRPFTLLDHHLQCAATLAARHPDDIELQIAGLLHDIGHTLLPDAPERHAALGAGFVRPLLGARVAGLIGLHVAAKRYLVATEAGYRATLTMGSAETLIAQGEAMAADEAAAFADLPLAPGAIALRRADEAGKVPGVRVPPLEAWQPVLAALAGR